MAAVAFFQYQALRGRYAPEQSIMATPACLGGQDERIPSSSKVHTNRHAECTFTVEKWEENPFSDIEGQLKMTHTSVVKAFHGDLEGQGTLQYLMFYGPDEQTRVLGLERITGVLDGQSGSFVIEHIGGDDGYEARGTVMILPGSGTGVLAGIRGSGEAVANRKGEFTMSLDYELD